MNEAGAVLFGLAATVVLAALGVLWLLWGQREEQLRTAQGERMIKSLRDALLRENSNTPPVGMLALVDPSPIPGHHA
jgi:hypothetical protein